MRNNKQTDEGSPNDDDSYLGYSVATGEFTGDKDLDVAVGMPRGANLTGKVKQNVFWGVRVPKRYFFTHLIVLAKNTPIYTCVSVAS